MTQTTIVFCSLKADLYECTDGLFCNSTSCCNGHGGRARCPQAMPVMCAVEPMEPWVYSCGKLSGTGENRGKTGETMVKLGKKHGKSWVKHGNTGKNANSKIGFSWINREKCWVKRGWIGGICDCWARLQVCDHLLYGHACLAGYSVSKLACTHTHRFHSGTLHVSFTSAWWIQVSNFLIDHKKIPSYPILSIENHLCGTPK